MPLMDDVSLHPSFRDRLPPAFSVKEIQFSLTGFSQRFWSQEACFGGYVS